jgi:hypothetical protein
MGTENYMTIATKHKGEIVLCDECCKHLVLKLLGLGLNTDDVISFAERSKMRIEK